MSLDNVWQVNLIPYGIPFTKPEIDALDLILSRATKDDFGSKENIDIIQFLSGKVYRYRMALEDESRNHPVKVRIKPDKFKENER